MYFSRLNFLLSLGLSWVFFLVKYEFFSLSSVWLCFHVSVCVQHVRFLLQCVCVWVCACIYVAGCVLLLQCVCGRVSECMSDRTAPRVTVLLTSAPPPALKQHTLPPALPLGWLWVDWGSLPWVFLELNAFYREDGCSVSQCLNLLPKASEIRISESILSWYPFLSLKL